MENVKSELQTEDKRSRLKRSASRNPPAAGVSFHACCGYDEMMLKRPLSAPSLVKKANCSMICSSTNRLISRLHMQQHILKGLGTISSVSEVLKVGTLWNKRGSFRMV